MFITRQSLSAGLSTIESAVFLPKPRHLIARAGALELSNDLRIVCQGDATALFPIAQRLQQHAWEALGCSWGIWSGEPQSEQVVLTLEPASGISAQGYRLTVTPERLHLQAADKAGAFYGAMTLCQLLRQSAGSLPACEIEDHPDFPVRGVMLDVSRTKVPKLETLFALVDELAAWKINHLELYTEHTFAYRNHPEVWSEASPLSGEEILKLDAYCSERFIELVPNQNSFGHLHRWLSLPRYRELAECMDGWLTPWGVRRMEPYSLNPGHPRSLALLEDLYADLLPHFSSRKFNVGCDETWDLGQGASKEACAEKGKGRVYLEFLLKIHDLVTRHGRTMHFWGDIILQHPELIPELPRDAVALAWGYEADHPFAQEGAKFAASGIPFYVCPGTSSWNAIAGRTDNCLANLRNAAANGLKHGAIGFLNTDWGDNGHWQPLCISYLGFAAGAALSWAYEANLAEDIRAALDVHAFQDAAGVMGKLAYDLGNAYLQPGLPLHNASGLFHLLFRDDLKEFCQKLSEVELIATKEYVQSVIAPLGRARLARADAGLITREFGLAATMLQHACDRALELCTGRLPDKDALATEMRSILGTYRALWTARNRVGGLDESTRVLELRLHEYGAGA